MSAVAFPVRDADVQSLRRKRLLVLLKPGRSNVLLCPRKRLSEPVALLPGKGVHASVAAEQPDYIFGEVNQLTNRLRQALKR